MPEDKKCPRKPVGEFFRVARAFETAEHADQQSRRDGVDALVRLAHEHEVGQGTSASRHLHGALNDFVAACAAGDPYARLPRIYENLREAEGRLTALCDVMSTELRFAQSAEKEELLDLAVVIRNAVRVAVRKTKVMRSNGQLAAG